MTERDSLRTDKEEEKKPEALNKAQVDYAHELLEELHPIEKTPVYVAFPYLKPFSSACCHGLPYCVPVQRDGEANTNSQVGEMEEGFIMQQPIQRTNTVKINGKEV